MNFDFIDVIITPDLTKCNKIEVKEVKTTRVNKRKKKIISPRVFKKRMEKLAAESGNEPERFHVAADNLLTETLKSLGYKGGIDIFVSIEKYYA